MKFVNAEQLLTQAQEAHKSGDWETADKMYNALLSKSLGNPSLTYLLGTLNMQKGNNGLAILLLQDCVNRMPDFGAAWNNLAICLKKEDHNQSADFAFEQAEKYMNTPDIPCNRASIYVNNGTPEKCLEHAERALAIDPNHTMAKWHKALALLEMGKWDEAWDYHEARIEPNSGCDVAERNYNIDKTPWWDGKSKGLVVIHGEQGLGDEIMFSSCLPDAIKTGAEIAFECAPRIQGLMQRSFPEIQVIGTHELDGKEWLNGRKVDYKLAIGSLPKFFRRAKECFPGKPYLKPDLNKKKSYRERLEALGSKPKVGIAWQGGVIRTRVDLRSIHLLKLKEILSLDADFISLQYNQTAKEDIQELFDKTGLVVHHWEEAATGKDMDDQAALISELDAVVTVCQTAVHVAGGLGVPTYVFTPSRPSWRYGVKGDMPWYNSVSLYRQKEDGWESVIKSVKDDLCSYLKIIDSKTNSFTNRMQAMA